MIRRIDIAGFIAPLAVAILCLPSLVRVVGAETAPEPAPVGIISGDLVRSIISTRTREQIEAAESEDLDGSTRYEVRLAGRGTSCSRRPVRWSSRSDACRRGPSAAPPSCAWSCTWTASSIAP